MIDKSSVFELLENALQNGYEINKWSAIDITRDMQYCCSFCELIPTEELLPIITEWKRTRWA